MDEETEAMAAAVRGKIPNLKQAALGSEYSYHSLPLCVIDSVFSIGVRYRNAQNAVESWCISQRPVWQKFKVEGQPRHTISDFIRIAEGNDGEVLSQRFFGGNRQRTSTRGGILKAEATVLFAKALKSAGVEDFLDVQDEARVAAARRSVSTVTGHKSGISFDYLMMLAGDDSFVKADRMICRFVANALGCHQVSPAHARMVVASACQHLAEECPNLTPRLLDHLIWLYQREKAEPAR